jgi:hypothetical protein
MYEGLSALCFCAAQKDNLMVSLELVQDDHRFATYGYKKKGNRNERMLRPGRQRRAAQAQLVLQLAVLEQI